MTIELLRAFSKAGNYVAGAFDGDELVGACVGFFGAPADEALHSHIAGVSAGARGRSVGFALKLHQRAWALLRGVSAVTWTFDPLVRRNAYFNLAKLGAPPEEYLANFYGGMHDAINGDDDSDRLLVHWRLDAPTVVAACVGTTVPVDAEAERTSGAAVALGISALGAPELGTLDGPALLVAAPADIEILRVRDPGCAKDWRIALREVLGTLIADGARVAGFDRAGWYVLHRPGAGRAQSMKLTGVELRRISMPLVAPFRTSFGTETTRDRLLLRVVTGDAEGWGECVAMADPLYSSEYVDAAADVLRRFLIPALAAVDRLDAYAVAPALARLQGATGWPRRRWRWPCSTPSCAPRAVRSRASSVRCATAFRAASRSAS